jgi:hypothetical protein
LLPHARWVIPDDGSLIALRDPAVEVNEMPKKVYYRATGLATFDWVDSPEKATQTDKESAEVTQKQLKDTELAEIPSKRQNFPSSWVISREIISVEEKMAAVRKVEAELRGKALEAGLPEPFISWVTDANDGVLMLDAPPVSDTSGLKRISWDSNRFHVTVFCQSRRIPLSASIDF